MICYNIKKVKKKNTKKMFKPYFKDRNFKLIKANSLEFLATLKEDSVDMIFADFPYMLSNGDFSCNGGKMVSLALWLSFLTSAISIFSLLAISSIPLI